LAPEADDDCWHQVYLPHDWRDEKIEFQHGWYAFDLSLNVPPNRLWTLYIPRVTSNVLASLNGEAIGHGGRLEDPVARNWSRPLRFSIPSGILLHGDNRFSLHVKSAPGSPGYLGVFYLGPEEILRPVYKRNYGFRIDMVENINFSLILLAVLILGFWIKYPSDQMYVWFAVICFTWALHNLNLLVVEIPVSTRIWETFRHLTLGWFVVFLVFGMNRYLHRQYDVVERIAVICALLGSAVMVAIPNDDTFTWYTEAIWLNATLSLGAYPAYRALHTWWCTWNPEYLLGICAGTPMFLAGFHDALRANGLVSREQGFFIQYTAPILLLGFMVVLLIRFVRALNESEALTQSLELRVEKKRLELKANYQRLNKMERAQALAGERERIMRDMHDGVGGQLVSALAISESRDLPASQLQGLLSSALLDLRLMIDSLDQNDGDLVSLLGTVRSRMQPALDQSGITIRWEVDDLPALSQLGPDRSLQILRILQEAITNVIKHAQATTLRIATGETQSTIFVEIADDGIGFDDTAAHGRGLHNMRYRANLANAEIKIDSSSQGTSLRVILPFNDTIPNSGDSDSMPAL